MRKLVALTLLALILSNSAMAATPPNKAPGPQIPLFEEHETRVIACRTLAAISGRLIRAENEAQAVAAVRYYSDAFSPQDLVEDDEVRFILADFIIHGGWQNAVEVLLEDIALSNVVNRC